MNLTYEITKNGYAIYLDGNLWIEQGEKSNFFFPCRVNNKDGSVNLEESCKAHIEELKAAQQQQVSQEERIKQLEAQVAALLEALQKGE